MKLEWVLWLRFARSMRFNLWCLILLHGGRTTRKRNSTVSEIRPLPTCAPPEHNRTSRAQTDASGVQSSKPSVVFGWGGNASLFYIKRAADRPRHKENTASAGVRSEDSWTGRLVGAKC